MLELAHGLAPAAHLAFATADNGDLDFARQITRLRTVNHATVLVDDVSYFDEPFFQDGPIAQAANAASAAGVPYFSAAGNSNVIVGGNNVGSYEAPSFRSTSCPASVTAFENAPGAAVTGCHDFDPSAGVDNGDAVTVAANGGFDIDLQWAQPWGHVTTDYDLFVLNAAGSVVASSDFDQAAVAGAVRISRLRESDRGPADVWDRDREVGSGPPARLKFVFAGSAGITGVQYNTSTGGDIVGPTIFGHNGAASVGTTGAIPYDNSNTPETYSSRGPVTLYFKPTPSTTPLPAPSVLSKPDFAATDNVSNVFFIEPSGGGFRFPGTSAAAPQAAAIGALLRQHDPGLPPAQIMATLSATAQPVATNGTPADVGGGYLDANAALASVVPLPGAPRVVSNSNGNTRTTLAWSKAPASPKSPVTGYRVTPIRGGVAQPGAHVQREHDPTRARRPDQRCCVLVRRHGLQCQRLRTRVGAVEGDRDRRARCAHRRDRPRRAPVRDPPLEGAGQQRKTDRRVHRDGVPRHRSRSRPTCSRAPRRQRRCTAWPRGGRIRSGSPAERPRSRRELRGIETGADRLNVDRTDHRRVEWNRPRDRAPSRSGSRRRARGSLRVRVRARSPTSWAGGRALSCRISPSPPARQSSPPKCLRSTCS